MSPRSLMGSAALAIAAFAIPAAAQEQASLPPVCMAFNEAGRDTHSFDALLSKTIEILKKSPEFSNLQKRAPNLKTLCPSALPEGLLMTDNAMGAMHLNIMAGVTPAGIQLIDPATASKLAAIYVGEVTYAMSVAAVSAEPQFLKGTDDVETHAIVTSMVVANAVTDQAIAVIDHAIRTKDESGIKQAYNEHKPFASVIGKYHEKALKSKTELKQADRDAFRNEMLAAATKNGDMRAGLIGGTVEFIKGATMTGNFDPTTVYNSVADSKSVGALLSPRLGGTVDAAKIIDDARAYWKAQPKDPAAEAIKALTHIQEMFQGYKDKGMQTPPVKGSAPKFSI